MEKNGKVRWYGYVAFAFFLIFFSGIFKNAEGWLRVLDFSNVMGNFGKLGQLTEGSGTLANDFMGTGGTGPRHAFLLALTIIPQLMFVMGVIKVVEHFDGIKAAEKVLQPILKLLLGVPGSAGLALVASLQSADGGASMTKMLKESEEIDEKQHLILAAFQFASPASLVNFFVFTTPVLGYFKIPTIIMVIVILICKIISGNLVRLFLHFKKA